MNYNQQMNGPSTQPQPVYGPNVPVQTSNFSTDNDTLLSPWAYVGYSLLFAIPILGFIMMLVYAFGNGNRNRKNFARGMLLLGILAVILAFVLIVGFGFEIRKSYS